MMNAVKIRAVGGACVLGFSLLGCGGAEPEHAQQEPTPIAEIAEDLALGSRGPDVLAVHQALKRMGYFQNDELAERYPSWRPLLNVEPADPLVFDAASAEAVRVFQRLHRIAETGIFEAETRAVMAQPRCGNPEGLAQLDPSDKYHQTFNQGLGTATNIPIKIIWQTGFKITEPEFKNAISAAFERWSFETKLSYPVVTDNSALIEFNFGKIMAGASGQTAPKPAPSVSGAQLVTLDGRPGISEWNEASATMVLVHEIGHALGLQHSSFSGSAMQPWGNGTTSLGLDDKIAISQGRDEFEVLPGVLKGITIGSEGTVLGLSTVRAERGYQIFKWNEAIFGWEFVNGHADRIAVDSAGTQWAVSAQGVVSKRPSGSTSAAAWVDLGGCASDIAAGGGGVWIIDCTPGNAKGIWKFNPTKPISFPWDPAVGLATKIAVGSDGRPWVATSAGGVFKRNSSSPSTGVFIPMPGCVHALAINPANYPVAIGCDGQGVWAWNEQESTTTGLPPAVAQLQWVRVQGFGTPAPVNINASMVAVGRKGELWTVDSGGTVRRAKR